MQEDNILESLAAKADEENKERDKKINERFDKKNKKNSGKKDKKTDKQSEKAESPARWDTGEMDPIPKELPYLLSDEPQEDTESNPFNDYADQISREGKALQEAPRKNNNNPRIKGVKVRSLGEEITEEQAEKIIEGEDNPPVRKGHRRTVIVRTKIVEKEDSEEKPKSSGNEAPAREEKAPEKLPPKLLLVREDTGEIWNLDRDMNVGRDEDNDIVIPNPEGHYVSAHHARISLQGKDIYLKDLGSTNGTYINDRKVGSWRLKAGNTVEFADIKFKIVDDA